MLLKRLIEYAETRMNMPPSMYAPTPIRWIAELDLDGTFKGYVQTSGGGKKDRGQIMTAPLIQRTSGVKPNLLVGDLQYVFGKAKEGKKAERAVECAHAFRQLIEEAYKATGIRLLEPIVDFLASAPAPPADMEADDQITFRVGGCLPFEEKALQAFWAARNQPKGAAMKCIGCGTMAIPAEVHPIKIKKIPGGQTSGVSLISANSDAFESYGLKRSLIAPTCQRCAEAYGKALQHLIDGESTSLVAANVRYIFWTKKETPFNPAVFLRDPDPGEVKKLIQSAFSGKRAQVDATEFYAASLKGSGGRLVVMDYLETSLENAQRNLARFFRLQEIMDLKGESRFHGIFPLASSLYQSANNISPTVPKALMRFALHGGAMPRNLLFLAVNRNRAEQSLTHPRAAMIKMLLLTDPANPLKEDSMQTLQEELDNAGYQCGRLLAVLESIQSRALPGINQTLVDRFYGTASSAPASVFSRLVHMAQNHLGKLRKDKPGTAHALEDKLEGVMGRITAFPSILNLNDQGYFALGYYHQKAWDSAKARECKEKQNKEESNG